MHAQKKLTRRWLTRWLFRKSHAFGMVVALFAIGCMAFNVMRSL